MKVCIPMNFPLRTALAVTHSFFFFFLMVVFSLSFVSRYFLISIFISLLIYWLFSNFLFSLHVIAFSSFFPLWLISSSVPLWSEKMLEVISVLLNLSRLVLCPSMWSVLEKVPCALKKNIYSVSFG